MRNPNNQSYVPVPESSWGRVSKHNLGKLEQLLKYWDVEIRKAIASMDAPIAQYANASAAANAAAAFIKFVPITSEKKTGGNFELEMLKATLDD